MEVEMRKVVLNMKEEEKYKVIKRLANNKCNKKRASIELDCTVRHVNRMLSGYLNKGKLYFIHGNRGRLPYHSVSNELKDTIELLYISKYYDCTYTSFTEYLRERENIFLSVDEIRSILKERFILSPKSHKSTKRLMKKELSRLKDKATTKAAKEKLQTNIVALEDAHPRLPRCQYFGEEVQMDACNHLWFGKEKSHLHAVIDDSTGILLGMFFDKQETLFGYYNITKQMLLKYGIPYILKTDKRTVFEYKKKGTSNLEEDTFTQYAYACNQLGIHLEAKSIPQFKPRIERVFGTLQNRLPQELRLANITTIDDANEFLKTYINKFNEQFGLLTNDTKSVFEKQLKIGKKLEEDSIDLILSILSKRVIDKGHSIKYRKKYYRLVNKRGMPIYFMRGTECVIIESFDNKLYATIENNIFALEEIPRVQALSENFDEIPEKKDAYVYIPSIMHPWKKSYIEQFLKKQELKLGKTMS